MLASKRTKIRIPERIGVSRQEFEESWAVVRDAIDHIYDNDVSGLSFEKIYHTVYIQVIRGKADKMYSNINSYMSEKVVNLFNSRFLAVKIESRDDAIGFLRSISETWTYQCNCFKMLTDLMMYLDKVYPKANRKQVIYDLCLELFKIHVLKPLTDYINKALEIDLNYVRGNNDSTKLDEGTWKNVISMMETLEDGKDNFFLNYCEPHLINQTELFYQETVKLDNLTLNEYLEKINDTKHLEHVINTLCFNSYTTSKIISSLDRVLVLNKAKTNLPKFIQQCINEKNSSLLGQLYKLSDVVAFKLKIIDNLKKCINDDLEMNSIDSSIRKRSQAAFKWSKSLIEIYTRYESFLNNINFDKIKLENSGQATENIQLQIIDSAFSTYLNSDCPLCTEMIVLYLDTYMKSIQDNNGIVEVKIHLEYCVKIFTLLSEKDIFESIYKQHLSRRLLQQRSIISLEKWLVQRIKDRMGNFFTSKLEGMLRDIHTSYDLFRTFKNLHETELADIEYTPHILTMTVWPFTNNGSKMAEHEPILLRRLQNLQNDFESFYTKKYNQRTLKWSFSLSMMEIGFDFEKTYHELIMPYFSAIIFLLFETHDELTRDKISELTNIPQNELNRHLLSLSVAPRSKLLKKDPPTKGITSKDVFSINYSFTAPTCKVKIQTVNIISNPSSKSESNLNAEDESLQKERLQIVNAAIIRVMKANKKLMLPELREQVFASVQHIFKLSNQLLQKAIEYLLDKEYLQRDPDDVHIYHYLP